MLTKIKHNINRTSVKLVVLLTAGLIAGALISSGAWAQGIPHKLDAAACSALQTTDAVVFVVGQTGHVTTYYGEETSGGATVGPWINPKTNVNLMNSVSIGVSVGNPIYCFTLGGARWCIEY